MMSHIAQVKLDAWVDALSVLGSILKEGESKMPFL